MSDQFYTALSAALITLLGVIVTIYFAQRNFDASLANERRKARDEREFSARQTAVSQAADAIMCFIQYYMTLPDKDLPEGGAVPAEVREFGLAVNRMHFYCTLETIEQATEAAQLLNDAFIAAVKAKMPSVFLGADLKIADLQIANLERMNEAIRSEIEALLQSDPQNSLIVVCRN